MGAGGNKQTKRKETVKSSPEETEKEQINKPGKQISNWNRTATVWISVWSNYSSIYWMWLSLVLCSLNCAWSSIVCTSNTIPIERILQIICLCRTVNSAHCTLSSPQLKCRILSTDIVCSTWFHCITLGTYTVNILFKSRTTTLNGHFFEKKKKRKEQKIVFKRNLYQG